MKLYPIKFEPILVSKIWGGTQLSDLLRKLGRENNLGESWEISAIEGHESIVCNGPLKGTTIVELIEQYGERVLGQHVIDKCGKHFPLLIKYIDAADDLSIQVHPNDALAWKKHQSKGKTEMWYVLKAQGDARLLSGFKGNVDAEMIRQAIDAGNFTNLMNSIKVDEGSTFFIPAGRVHAIGKGILLAEIQQSSDITYRLYDYNRIDKNGKKRDLHIEDSLEAINYKDVESGRVDYAIGKNGSATLVKCPYFQTNILEIKGQTTKSYTDIDSFVILMNVSGEAQISTSGGDASLRYGETILIPGEIKDITIYSNSAKLLEVYIP